MSGKINDSLIADIHSGCGVKALEGCVEVLTFGAEKYARENWKKVPDGKNRYFAALMRHLTAWQNGEKVDPESGKSHLDHAMCNLYFLKNFDKD